MNTEQDVLNFWTKIHAFERSITNNDDCPSFIFYDGPPFATGLPHYGHLLASTIKDIIGRYWTMRGFRVERRFGWDAHGLPIEYEIEKKLGIKTRQEIEQFTIPKYNEECRSIVMRYSNEWRSTIEKLGRWVDFDNNYKTMDKNFMESVWWVFAQLFKQKKVYQSVKVMPYSTACTTPLSNFEAKSNYKEVLDPSIIIKFKANVTSSDKLGPHITPNYPVYFLVWTTTPWTLFSNLAICVNPNLIYVLLKVNYGQYQEGYILTNKCANLFIQSNTFNRTIDGNPVKPTFEIMSTIKGELLQNLKYEPLFPFFVNKYPHCFKVISDTYVTEENGTGIVHIAPAFGEDDFRVGKLYNLIHRDLEPPCPIDNNGCFTNEVGPNFEKTYFKDVDPLVITDLKSRNLLFSNKKESHEYPFCWRSDTPLMYRTVKCWFIDVVSIKEKLIANNMKINWVPKFIGQNKFHDWLSNVQDWCVSRNRYWGTPLPIWMSPDEEEVICIESIAQLESLANLPPGSIKDLHRHHIDSIIIPSQIGKDRPPLRRIEAVFDCWFESGSMPYAQFHYPFENKEKFEKNFPCDFIAEGSDQTRGWFYTLLVISTLLFDKPAFKNVIVNGIVLAEDGEKMSKRKQNYPDANLILEDPGADALRLYLINSKVVRADSLAFKRDDLKIITKGIHMMVKNMVQYWIETKDYYNKLSPTKWYLINVLTTDLTPEKYQQHIALSNPLDSWILHSLSILMNNIHTNMEMYDLSLIVVSITNYIDHLSRWYIKLNKTRFRNIDKNDLTSLSDVQIGLSVLFECLYQFCLGLAPFAPFLSEMVFQSLKQHSDMDDLFKESVHFHRLSTKFYYTIDTQMNSSMSYLIRVMNLIRHQRSMREKSQSIKMPYKKVIVIHNDPEFIKLLKPVEHIIKEEINIIDLEYQNSMSGYVNYTLLPNLKVLGPKLGHDIKNFIKYLSTYPADEVESWVENKRGPFFWNSQEIDRNDIIVKTSPKQEFITWQVVSDEDLVLLIDPEVNDDLLATYYLKQFTRQSQDFRRKNGLQLGNNAVMHYSEVDENKYFTNTFIQQHLDHIKFLCGTITNDLNQIDQTKMKKIAECKLLLDTERNSKDDPNPEKIFLSLYIPI